MKKILIVDDEEDLLDVLKLFLTSHGFEVITHSSGFNVPDLVKEIKPDLILLDILLPGKSGTQICNELKALSNLPPIILFSAHAKESEALAKCMADAFISKPFDLNDIIEAVKRYAA